MGPDETPFVDRTTAYVRRHPLLRAMAGLTLLNYLFSIVLGVRGSLSWVAIGYLVLLSALSWFFAVGVPMMNRAIRERAGIDPTGYWGGIVELFARVVLCAQTGIHSFLLVEVAFRVG
ncbi:MAG: hypothetical protein AAGD14_03975 [Planctomycetota bacterium]